MIHIFKRSEGKGLKVTALVLGIIGNVAILPVASIFLLNFILISALGGGKLSVTESNILNFAPITVIGFVIIGIILSSLSLKVAKLSGWYLIVESIIFALIIYFMLQVPVLQMTSGPTALTTLLILPIVLILLTSGIILLTNRSFIIVFDLLLIVTLIVINLVNYFNYKSLSKTDQLVQSCESSGYSYEYCVYIIYLSGKANPDLSYCNKMNPNTDENNYYRNSCYQSVATYSNDKSVCSLISNDQAMVNVCLK